MRCELQEEKVRLRVFLRGLAEKLPWLIAPIIILVDSDVIAAVVFIFVKVPLLAVVLAWLGSVVVTNVNSPGVDQVGADIIESYLEETGEVAGIALDKKIEVLDETLDGLLDWEQP